MKQLHNSLSIR